MTSCTQYPIPGMWPHPLPDPCRTDWGSNPIESTTGLVGHSCYQTCIFLAEWESVAFIMNSQYFKRSGIEHLITKAGR